LGRWSTRDRLNYADGLNLYEYVNDSPITAIDPQGLASREPDVTNVSFLCGQCNADAEPGSGASSIGASETCWYLLTVVSKSTSDVKCYEHHSYGVSEDGFFMCAMGPCRPTGPCQGSWRVKHDSNCTGGVITSTPWPAGAGFPRQTGQLDGSPGYVTTFSLHTDCGTFSGLTLEYGPAIESTDPTNPMSPQGRPAMLELVLQCSDCDLDNLP